MRAGDFLLANNTDRPISRVIRFGQNRKHYHADKRFTCWNHSALITSETGDLIEAQVKGVIHNHIDVLRPGHYRVVEIEAMDDVRTAIANYAEQFIGKPYSWEVLPSILLRITTGISMNWPRWSMGTCSGFIAHIYRKFLNEEFELPTSLITPYDLARHFNAQCC